MSDKDYNGHLLDQLAMLDRLEEIARAKGDEEIIKAIEKERRWVELKLNQNPPSQVV